MKSGLWVAAIGWIVASGVFFGAAPRALAGDCVDDAVAMIDELTTTVNDVVDSTGLRNGLQKKLREARSALTDANPNNDHVAVRKLGDFMDQVRGATPKRISEEVAQDLLDRAQAIIDALGACENG